ncbi:MAG: AI-2E family transporter [Syntrophomonadaceae bacterium]
MIAINIKARKDYIFLITYAAILILAVLNIGTILQAVGRFLALFTSLFIGIAIAFILHKPCQYIEKVLKERFLKNGSPALIRGLAVLNTLLLALLIIAILMLFIIPQLIESVRLFASNIESYLANTQSLLNQGANLLQLAHIDLSQLLDRLYAFFNQLTGNLGGLLAGIIGVTAGVFGFLANLLLAMIFAIYLLSGREKILGNCRAVARAYLPAEVYDRALYVYRVTVDCFDKYVYGQLTEAFILGALTTIGMIIFGFEYPLMIGTLIGLTALVPIVGTYIGGLIAFLVLLMVSPPQALWFVVFLVILQQLENNLIYPRVVGDSLGLPGIWVLLAAIVGGGLAGPLGILLGVPVAAVLYKLLKNDVYNRVEEA